MRRWCPRKKILHLQGAELGGIWALKEPEPGELTPLGSMDAGIEQTPPAPSYGEEPLSWIFQVKVFEAKEEGRSLTLRSSHPGLNSGSHPQRGAASPRCPATSSLCVSRRITHSDARCARCTSSEPRGFHLLRAGGLAREVRPSGLGRLTLGPCGPQPLKLPGCWAVARPQSGDTESQSGKPFPRP